MENITKRFPGVVALDNVNFSVEQGEIHCLVGENGAGKSTLMKILSGVYGYGNYEGNIIINGVTQKFASTKDSEHAGISIISQEIALLQDLTIYENIFMGHEIMKGRLIDWQQTIIQAREYLKRVKLNVNPLEKVGKLRIGEQQLVEIAKAISKHSTLLILDEPTSSLNENESRNLLSLLRQLKKEGVTSIMISHRLKEVVEIADSITVLRDGATICTLKQDKGKVPESELVRHMVGRSIVNVYPESDHEIRTEKALEVKNWTVHDPLTGKTILNDINFHVYKGELLGFAGLMGAGRTELALSIFGNAAGYKMISGSLEVHGKQVRFKEARDAIDAGLAYVTEDRKRNGLVLMQDIKFNTTIAKLERLIHQGVVNEQEEIMEVNKLKQALNIRAPNIEQKVLNLSGGNQQKVSVAKWLFAEPSILILDEPTRGIDVGAKHEMYLIMNDLLKAGLSVIMISSDLPEILGMCDRIYVLSNGKLTGELSRDEATEEKIMSLATDTKEDIA